MTNFYCHLCETVFTDTEFAIICISCDSTFIEELRDILDTNNTVPNNDGLSNTNEFRFLPPPVDTGLLIEFDGGVSNGAIYNSEANNIEFDNGASKNSENNEYTDAIPESFYTVTTNAAVSLGNVQPPVPSITDVVKENVSKPEFNQKPLEFDIKSMVAHENTRTNDDFVDLEPSSRIIVQATTLLSFSESASNHSSLPVSQPTIYPPKKINSAFLNFFRKKSRSEGVIKDISIKSTNFSERDECSICLRTYKSTSHVRLTQCGHKFHDQCLTTWINVVNFK